ncbi:hypothetical protein MKW98_021115, partial [Papaver atlanticum]
DSIWRTKPPKDSYGVSVWRHIYSVADDFFKMAQFKLGKGDTVRLWEDKWGAQGTLESLCPNLYRITTSKQISVLHARTVEGSSVTWNLGIAHNRLYDAEIAELVNIFPLLDLIFLDPDQEDDLVWVGDKSGKFSVKSAYNLQVAQDQLVLASPDFPCKQIWSRRWPPKFAFFLWQAVLERLPTLDNLQKRGSAIISTAGDIIPNKCILCQTVEESVNHIFIHCSFAKKIWKYFFDCADKTLNLPVCVKDLIKDWKVSGLSVMGKEIWTRLPTSVMWNVWCERNSRTFTGKLKNPNAVINMIQLQLFNWGSTVSCFTGILVDDIIINWKERFFDPP